MKNNKIIIIDTSAIYNVIKYGEHVYNFLYHLISSFFLKFDYVNNDKICTYRGEIEITKLLNLF